MTSAQQYYDGLVQQGHDAAMALSYTQQHYPDFSAEIPAPEPTPQPMTVAPAAPVVANVTAVAPSSGGWAIQTADFGLFFTKILAALLTMITFGFGYPWAKTMVFGKWASKVRIDGRSIRYTGTGVGLFGVWVKVFLLSIITIGIYYLFWGKKAVPKYVDAHLEWA